MTDEQVKRCQNCGYTEERYFPTGRCWACYQYQRRHGVERPPNPETLRNSRIRECVRCGEVKEIGAKGLCKTCYGYKRLRDAGKPEKLMLAGRNCANPDCGRVIKPGTGARHERCQACAVFWKRHGRDIQQDEMTAKRRSKT